MTVAPAPAGTVPVDGATVSQEWSTEAVNPAGIVPVLVSVKSHEDGVKGPPAGPLTSMPVVGVTANALAAGSSRATATAPVEPGSSQSARRVVTVPPPSQDLRSQPYQSDSLLPQAASPPCSWPDDSVVGIEQR